MRPKKSLLLLCPDSERESELTFVLRFRGYRVMSSKQDVNGNDKADGVLIVLGVQQSTSSVASQLKELATQPNVPILMVWEGGGNSTKAPPSTLALHSVPMVDLINLLQAMLTKKRGPKSRADGADRSVTAAVAVRSSNVTAPLAGRSPRDTSEASSGPHTGSTERICLASRSSNRDAL